MKILKIILALGSLCLLGLVILVWKAPSMISSLAEKELTKMGFDTQIVVEKLSISGLDFKVTLKSPYKVEAPGLQLRWDLRDWRRSIPFTLQSTQSEMAMNHSKFDLRTQEFRVSGYYDWEKFVLEQLDVDLTLENPFRAKLLARSEGLGQSNLFRFNIEVPEQDWSQLSKIPGLSSFKPFNLEGRAQLREVSDLDLELSSKNPLWLKLPVLELPLEVKADGIEASIVWNVERGLWVKDFRTQIHLNFDGLVMKGPFSLKNFNIKKGGEGKLRLGANFRKSSLKNILKVLAPDLVKELQGPVSLKVDYGLKSGVWRSKMDVSGDISSVFVFAIPVENLSFQSWIKCQYSQSLECDVGDGSHRISIESAGEAYPFENFSMEGLVKDSKLSGSFRLGWIGSRIESKGLEGFVGAKKQIKTQLGIQGLDVAKMLGVVGMKNLAGEGKMSGVISLEYTSENGMSIPPSSLRSEGVGKISYKDPTTDGIPKVIDTLKEFNALLAKGQQALVYKALDNFHYKSLILEAQRPRAGELGFKLHLVGSNPDLANGQIFDISVPIAGQLEGLLVESSFRTLAESETSEEYVKRLRRMLEKKK